MRTCETCKHKSIERDGSSLQPLVCKHPTVAGRLRCRNCATFRNLDEFEFVAGKPAGLRCRHCVADAAKQFKRPETVPVQPMPKEFDPDTGFAGFVGDGGETPEFCPGFELDATDEPKPRKPKRKPKFAPNQMGMFD